MRAIILAGGKGTRLRPYTTLIPKPLVPLGGKYSILEIVLMQLSHFGFTHVTLAVNHLSHLIMAYFGDGARFGVHIDYSLEEQELSTIGPLTLIDDLPENFLVMNGDILTNLNYKTFLENHILRNSRISVAAYPRQVHIDFGVLDYNIDSGELLNFQEKPCFDFKVSMGVYCVSRNVVASLPRGVKYGFDDLMHDGLLNNDGIFIESFSGYWLDIGRPDDYQYADENFEELAKSIGVGL